MSNTDSNQSTPHWIEIDVTKFTDQSLKQLLIQSDGLALDGQFAIELGLYSPAGPASDTASPATLRIREIPDATDEHATTPSTATLSQPLIATRNVSHPGKRFLEGLSHATALTVTTETVTADPTDIQPATDGSFANQFENTAAGSVGAAAKYIPTRCTQDVYVQLLIVPDPDTGRHRRFEPFDPDGTEDHEPDSSTTFAVGISIFVGSPSTTEAVSQKTLQDEAMRVATKWFTPPNSTATFTYAWHRSTPPAEFINTPRLRPDATRYWWLSQHLGLAPINSIVQSTFKKVGIPLQGAHERLPLVREFLGTPAKIRVSKAGLRWLFGGEPANRPDPQTDG